MLNFIRRYETLFFLIFTLSGILLLGYLSEKENLRSLEKQEYEANKKQLEVLIAAGIKSRLDYINHHIRSLVYDEDSIDFIKGNHEKEEKVRKYWKDFLTFHPEFLYIYSTDQEGKLIFETRDKELKLPENYDAHKRPWFRQALQNPEEVIWTDPYYEIPGNNWVISIVYGFKDPLTNKVTNVFAIDIDTKHLNNFLTDIPLPEGGLLAILSQDKKIIAAPDKKAVEHLLNNPASFSAITKDRVNILKTLPDSPDLLIHTENLENPRWQIIQAMPKTCWQIPKTAGIQLALLIMSFTSAFFLLMHKMYNLRLEKDLPRFENELNTCFEKKIKPPISPWPFFYPFRNFFIRVVGENIKNKATIKKLQEEIDRFFEKAPIGIFKSNPEGRFSEANASMAKMLGYNSPKDLIQNINDIERELYLDQEDRKIVQNKLKEGSIFNFPVRFRNKNGTISHISITAYPERDNEGKIKNIRGFFIDLTRYQHLKSKLYRIARTDQLTGLPNRTSFVRLLEVETERFCRYETPFSLMVLDLDSFKKINKEHKHTMGDRLLIAFADKLSKTMRSCDTLARIDGDTFAIHMAQTSLEEARAAALRIKEAVQGKELIEFSEIFISFSAGISAPRDNLRCFEELLEETETLMYLVKAKGGNDILIYTEN